MTEYFIVSNSFAAPWVSETDYTFVEADTPEDALISFAATYKRKVGLYSAVAYTSANDYHKTGKGILARWLCNHEIAIKKITCELGAYTYYSTRPGEIEIDGELHVIEDPQGGRIVTDEEWAEWYKKGDLK